MKERLLSKANKPGGLQHVQLLKKKTVITFGDLQVVHHCVNLAESLGASWVFE